MPRFYFDSHQGHVTRDESGIELPHLNAAIQAAIEGLPAIAADAIPSGDDRQHFAIVVRDETGRPVYTAALAFTGTRLEG
jgi:hypothetical protein